MHAYRYDGFTGVNGITIHDEPEPTPQRGELLLRIRAVSLNYRDMAIADGTYPRAARPGLVPCSDAAAEVVALGAGVDDFAVGDRVISTFHPRWFGGPMPATAESDSYGSGQDGWLAQYKAVSREAVVRLPDSISDIDGATLPCAATTAWTALAGPVPIRAGHTVLTLGTGGVSLFGVQLATALGARVIATTSSAHKAEFLRGLGADEVIDYTATPDWAPAVRELTHGRGVDRVLEVGGPGTVNQSLKAVGAGGEVALIGFLSRAGDGVDYFLLKDAATRPITVGHRGDLEELVRVIESAGITAVIDRVVEFDDAADAFRTVAESRQVGKVVIRVC